MRRLYKVYQLRRFALWFFHSNSDTPGVFRNAFLGIFLSRWQLLATELDTLYPLNMMPLPGYWNADRDRTRTMNTRHTNSQCSNFLLVNLPLLVCERRCCYSRLHFGFKPEIPYATLLLSDNPSGAAVRMNKP